MLPLSYRLITFDTALLVKKSLNTLIQNGGWTPQPDWSWAADQWTAGSRRHRLGAALGFEDVSVCGPAHHVRLHQCRSVLLAESGRVQPDRSISTEQPSRYDKGGTEREGRAGLTRRIEVERAIGVVPIETVSANPQKPLYEACRRMLVSRARRIPLVDVDHETNRQMVVSVITQYRILKFVAVNVTETQMLRKPLKDLNIGTYDNVATARMETPVIDVIINMLVKRSISSVPIVDADGEWMTWWDIRCEASLMIPQAWFSMCSRRSMSLPSSRAACTMICLSAWARLCSSAPTYATLPSRETRAISVAAKLTSRRNSLASTRAPFTIASIPSSTPSGSLESIDS